MSPTCGFHAEMPQICGVSCWDVSNLWISCWNASDMWCIMLRYLQPVTQCAWQCTSGLGCYANPWAIHDPELMTVHIMSSRYAYPWTILGIDLFLQLGNHTQCVQGRLTPKVRGSTPSDRPCGDCVLLDGCFPMVYMLKRVEMKMHVILLQRLSKMCTEYNWFQVVNKLLSYMTVHQALSSFIFENGL